jgi:putative ABC transport system permease protein
MHYEELASAFDLDGAFNFVALTLSPGGSERAVIVELDRLLLSRRAWRLWSCRSSVHIRVSDEIRVLTTISVGFPVVFLKCAAFMVNAFFRSCWSCSGSE